MHLADQNNPYSGGGGDSNMKGGDARRLRGVNLEFWSYLGCSLQNAIIFSRQGLV